MSIPQPAPTHRARTLTFPLDFVCTAFLHQHTAMGGPRTYANGALLRQPSLPDDARLLSARCDYTANPPALVVVVASDAWEAAPQGAEPPHDAIDWNALTPLEAMQARDAEGAGDDGER